MIFLLLQVFIELKGYSPRKKEVLKISHLNQLEVASGSKKPEHQFRNCSATSILTRATSTISS